MTETTETNKPRRAPRTQHEKQTEQLEIVRRKQERNRGRRTTLAAEMAEAERVRDALAHEAAALEAAISVLERKPAEQSDDQTA